MFSVLSKEQIVYCLFKTLMKEPLVQFSVVVESMKRNYDRRGVLRLLLWSKGMELELKEVYKR